MIEADLYSRLTAQVTAVSGRVYPLEAPKKFTCPLIVYSVVAQTKEATLDGVTDFTVSFIQIDCYASTYLQSKIVAAAVTDAMIPWHGGDGEPHAILFHNSVDMIENTVSPNLYRVSQHWNVVHDA